MSTEAAAYVNAYVDGRDLILFQRDSSGVLKKSKVRAEYVVYLRAIDVPEDLRRQLTNSNHVKSFAREGEWYRVGWTDRDLREQMCFGRRGDPSPLVAMGIPTYEGDVHPMRRFLTDTGSRIQKPRRGYFDLETDSRVPFSRKEEMRVLSWAFTDDEGKKRSRVLEADDDRAEHALLAEFWEWAAAYDQLLAWNGDNFDFPLIAARTERAGVRIDTRDWLYLDQLALFRRMNMHAAESGEEKQSMRLQSIAMATLGEGKDDFDASKTWQAWEAGGDERARLLKYNEKDTELLPKIEKKTGFADLFNTLADVCRVLPDTRGLNPTVQMDGYMLRLGKERGVHFSTKKFREGIEQFKGAFVMQPKCRGIARDIHVADFASLYPSIILTWNMSPETKRAVPPSGPVPAGMCRAPLTGQGFDADADGILPTALRELIAMRKFWSDKKASLPPGTPEWYDADRRSNAYKVAANSFYGVVGSPFSRFFDKNIAESVTQNGKWLIEKTNEAAEARGMSVVYADTDSCFVEGATRTAFEEFVKWCNTELYPGLLKSVGCSKNSIKLAYEKQFERIVFSGAKRYCGKYKHYKGKEATVDSKPEIKGLEYKRGDTAKLARQLQEQTIKLLMGGSEQTDDYKKIIDIALQHVLNDPLPNEEVILSKSLSKPLKEYAVRKKGDDTDAAEPPHVQIARMMEKQGQEVGEGTRIEYFVVDGTPGKPNVVCPASDYGQQEADRYYLWEALVYPPTQRLLQSAFPDYDWQSGYEKIRPPKPKGGRKKNAPEGQLGFLSAAPKADSRFDTPLDVYVRERAGTQAIEAIRAIAKKNPGSRPVVVHVLLESGARAVLDTSLKVSADKRVEEEFELAEFYANAASEELEAIACAN